MKILKLIFHPVKLTGAMIFLLTFMLNVQTYPNGELGFVSASYALQEEGYEAILEPCSYPIVAGTNWVMRCRFKDFAFCDPTAQIFCPGDE